MCAKAGAPLECVLKNTLCEVVPFDLNLLARARVSFPLEMGLPFEDLHSPLNGVIQQD